MAEGGSGTKVEGNASSRIMKKVSVKFRKNNTQKDSGMRGYLQSYMDIYRGRLMYWVQLRAQVRKLPLQLTKSKLWQGEVEQPEEPIQDIFKILELQAFECLAKACLLGYVQGLI